jgi:multidrug efflux pump subunit AcrA (membrane-fusion protein)
MFKKRSTWFIGGAVLIVITGALIWFFSANSSQSANTNDAPLQTATVRQGSLTISSSGVGSIVSTSSVPNTSQITQLIQANLSVLQAQVTYNSTLTNYPTEVAQAQVNLLAAQAAIEDATYARAAMNYSRCNNTTRSDYWTAYNTALERYNDNPVNENQDLLLNAEANWDYCNSPWSDTEIAGADADLAAAQATYDALESEYEAMLSNGSSSDLIVAESQLAIALSNLAALEPEALVEPADQTMAEALSYIQDVNNSGGVILLEDNGAPLVEIYLDEADLTNIEVGDTVSLTFDSISGMTYSGTIAFIYPELSSVSGVMVATALVQMDPASIGDTANQLLVGMSATAEVIQAQVENAILVPVEALREITDGVYAVFVVADDGSLEMRTVQVGIQDLIYAQITSGLEAGEVVSTGLVETGE